MCATRATMSQGSRRRTIASSAVRSSIEAVDIPAATAPGTSDTCIVASPLAPCRHDHQALRPAQDAELSILSRAARHLQRISADQRSPAPQPGPSRTTELGLDHRDRTPKLVATRATTGFEN